MPKTIGIYNAFMAARGGAEKRTVVLADHLSRTHDVSLLVGEPLDVAAIEEYFAVDLCRVKIVPVGGIPYLSQRPPANYKELREKLRAIKARRDDFRHIDKLGLDLFINNMMASKMLNPARHGIFMCMFPHQPNVGCSPHQQIKRTITDTLVRALFGRHPEVYDSYDIVTANSQFTAHWIDKWWDKKAEVVYSVCDPIPTTGKKEKIILSVGRFAADSPGSNYKCQDILLEAFKRMTDLHDAGWQLHLAGSLTANNIEDTKLVARLRCAAMGYPVVLHLDAALTDLQNLYSRASIYWHAAGYGYPEADYPSRQEHFGISTVEALSAGAVPIVIKAGGQRETVHHGENGFLWSTLDELAKYTKKVANDQPLRRRLAQDASACTGCFTREGFNHRMEKIVNRLID